jgi:hypothetical protein
LKKLADFSFYSTSKVQKQPCLVAQLFWHQGGSSNSSCKIKRGLAPFLRVIAGKARQSPVENLGEVQFAKKEKMRNNRANFEHLNHQFKKGERENGQDRLEKTKK